MVEDLNSKRWTNPLDKLKQQPDLPIYRTGLYVMNSLTNEKTEFITKDGSRVINWYMCGPTVYDSAHLGHARTYLSFDILRRILSNYFGYDVNVCMNVTDIDDKIIKRSNEQNIEFTQFAKMWEEDFFKDMKDLNVLYPNYITRVSEYIPEIVKFIEVLVTKQYSYEKNGSVYFDIEEFTKKNHLYAKLVPQNTGAKEKLDSLVEAEGELSKEAIKDKKNPMDFALWKASKDNEPFWESPWGKGRPGWHIECSVMCSSVFGESLDIHSGGVDLKFPHHDNEIAQTEAYYDHQQWINYFLHTGHLHIKGLKMSKSLKNFRKISEFINAYSPNTFRLYFSSTRWDATMDFTEEGLTQANSTDKYLIEFFSNIKVWLRENDLKRDLKFTELENGMMNELHEAKKAIHEALCDNFNTPVVLNKLLSLVSKTYEYQTAAQNTLKINLIYSIAQYVAFILKSLGLVYKTEFIDYFILDSTGQQNTEQILTPYIDALTTFRDNIKNAAIVEKNINSILKICDQLRDEILPYLGVKIEDKGKGVPSIWKFYDKEQYIKDLAKQKEIEENARLEKEQIAKEKELKLSTPAKEYYAMQTDKYSEFDAEGIPTHNEKGFEFSKEQVNKLKKEFKKHQTAHEKWKSQQSNK